APAGDWSFMTAPTTSSFPRPVLEAGTTGTFPLMKNLVGAPLGQKELDTLEEGLRAHEAELRALHEQVEKDSRGRHIARAIVAYRAADVLTNLDRARELLARRDYDVAFVGNFS